MYWVRNVVKKRFNRLEPSSLHQSDEESHISGDTLDIEADINDFASETRSILQEKSSDHDVDSVSNFSMDEGACASVEWKNFVSKMSRELGISLEQEKNDQRVCFIRIRQVGVSENVNQTQTTTRGLSDSIVDGGRQRVAVEGSH